MHAITQLSNSTNTFTHKELVMTHFKLVVITRMCWYKKNSSLVHAITQLSNSTNILTHKEEVMTRFKLVVITRMCWYKRGKYSSHVHAITQLLGQSIRRKVVAKGQWPRVLNGLSSTGGGGSSTSKCRHYCHTNYFENFFNLINLWDPKFWTHRLGRLVL